MTKHSNLNDLPIELHYNIISYLRIGDLFNLRLVSKKNNYAVGQFRIEELYFIDYSGDWRKCWLHTYKCVDFRFMIEPAKLSALRSSIFNLDCLKRLHIDQLRDDSAISLANLSSLFTRLEKLDIWLNPCNKDENKKLNLPNLKQLDIHVTQYQTIEFDLPKLDALRIHLYTDKTIGNLLKFSHPQTLRHLATNRFYPSLSIFQNLNSLKIYHAPKEDQRNVLSMFPMLNVLAMQSGYKAELANIIEQKSALKGQSLKIYYRDVELFEISEYDDINNIDYQFDYMRHYSRFDRLFIIKSILL